MPETPTVTYMLELTEQELLTLFMRLTFLKAKNNLDSPDEDTILEKVTRLMEGK